MYLTIEDIMQKYKLSRPKIYCLKRAGMPFLKIGRNVRFNEKEVETWMRENYSKPKGEKIV